MYTTRHTKGGPAPERPPLGVQAYATLKHDLLIGEFPLGVRLGEAALASRLNMSRTPVREALSRLHAEGLVVRQPDGGFSPAAPDLHTISELYEVRRSLEFTALERGDHDRARLGELHAEWSGMEAPDSDDDCSPDFVLHDEDFHLRLADASGNQALVALLNGVNERIRLVRMHDFLSADRVAATIAEHTGILDALLAPDDGDDGNRARVSTAADLLSRHLDVSEQVVEQRAALALSRMIGGRRG